MPISLLKFQRKLARLRKLWSDLRGASGQVYVHHRVDEYREMWRAAAAELGAGFNVLSDKIWEVRLGGRTTRIHNDILELDSPVTLQLAGMKPLVYQMLAEHGLPIPAHTVFRLDVTGKAYRFCENHRQGVVVKPARGTSSGQGVTTHIIKRKEVRRAAVLASLYCPELVIEPMIPGECYRALVLDGRTIHAVCRRGPRLTGDGSTSVAGLIEAENARRRGAGRPLLDIDRDTLFTLSYQLLSLDSVPANGQTVIVKSVADPVRKRVEVRTVYNEDVTELVCDSIKRAAEKAAGIIGSRFVGVDFITTDCTRPLEETGGVFNELNTTPGLHHHFDREKEAYPPAALLALKALLD
ncbi:MAG: hypothetical protein JSW34_12115 [Candidatus Zixiibacteriota bacterium]|nr:MAG: hypothetical protein JSW34_12115 [candidate division Zixibacteria bacterium]